MSEQGLLFRLERPAWIDRLWQTIDPKRRREIVSILAQMARHSLAVPTAMRSEERSDES